MYIYNYIIYIKYIIPIYNYIIYIKYIIYIIIIIYVILNVNVMYIVRYLKKKFYSLIFLFNYSLIFLKIF